MLAHKHPELRDAKYVVFADSSRRYVDCSVGVSDLLGYTRDEMLQKTIDDISYDVSAVPILFGKYLETRSQQGEYILQRKDRTPVPIRYTAFVFDDGCNAAIWEPIRDWRAPYMAALLELDPEKQEKHIDQALVAIPQSRSADTAVQKTLDEAVFMLKSLRKKLK
jgi:PAS domain-containing protein